LSTEDGVLHFNGNAVSKGAELGILYTEGNWEWRNGWSKRRFTSAFAYTDGESLYGTSGKSSYGFMIGMAGSVFLILAGLVFFLGGMHVNFRALQFGADFYTNMSSGFSAVIRGFNALLSAMGALMLGLGIQGVGNCLASNSDTKSK